MKNNKQLNDSDLNNIAGGSDLDKYLKTLAGNDKNKELVDYGTGKALDLNPSVDYDKSENLIIVKRENNKIEE